MLTMDRKELQCFNNFTTDYQLPKHKKETVDSVSKRNSARMMRGEDFDAADGMVAGGNFPINRGGSVGWSNDMIWDGISFAVQREYTNKRQKLFIEAYIALRKMFDTPKGGVKDYFSKVKKAASKLETSSKDVEGYEEILKRLEESGQRAMKRVAKERLDTLKHELTLTENGRVDYISEQKLIEFTIACEKGLRMDWIKDFTRVIPKKVIKEKDKADKLKVFDNYIILHYDPHAKIQVTKEKKKDPILFGLIRGSNKLYFIADWIDEICDLTYDKLIKAVGGKEELEASTIIEAINNEEE